MRMSSCSASQVGVGMNRTAIATPSYRTFSERYTPKMIRCSDLSPFFAVAGLSQITASRGAWRRVAQDGAVVIVAVVFAATRSIRVLGAPRLIPQEQTFTCLAR